MLVRVNCCLIVALILAKINSTIRLAHLEVLRSLTLIVLVLILVLVLVWVLVLTLVCVLIRRSLLLMQVLIARG